MESLEIWQQSGWGKWFVRLKPILLVRRHKFSWGCVCQWLSESTWDKEVKKERNIVIQSFMYTLSL